MPEQLIQLPFQGGMAGAPIPPARIGDSVQLMLNQVLTPGGAALRTAPGYYRTQVVKLEHPRFLNLPGRDDHPYISGCSIYAVGFGDPAWSSGPTIAATAVPQTFTLTYSIADGAFLVTGTVSAGLSNITPGSAISGSTATHFTGTISNAGTPVFSDGDKMFIHIGPDYTLKLFLVDGGDVFGVEGGTGYAVVDYAYPANGYPTSGVTPTSILPNTRRVMAVGVNALISPQQHAMPYTDGLAVGSGRWDPSLSGNYPRFIRPGDRNITATALPGNPILIPRVGRHEYPTIIPYEKKTFILSQWSPPIVDDGYQVRYAGLTQPKRRPIIHCAASATATVDAASAAANWTALGGSTVATGAAVRTPSWSDSASGYTKVTVATTTAGTNLAQCNTMSSGATYAWGSGMKKLRVRVRFDRDNSTVCDPLPENTLSVLLATADNLGGTVYSLPIPVPLAPDIWHFLELDAEAVATAAPTVSSVGWRLIKSPTVTNLTSAANGFTFNFAMIESVTTYTGPWTGEVEFCHTWYDPASGLESAPSPSTGLYDLGSGSYAISYKPMGYRGFYDTESNNFRADPVGVNLFPVHELPEPRIRIYASLPGWGTDEAGLNIWRLVCPEDGVIPDSSVITQGNENPGDYEIVEFISGDSTTTGTANNLMMIENVAWLTENRPRLNRYKERGLGSRGAVLYKGRIVCHGLPEFYAMTASFARAGSATGTGHDIIIMNPDDAGASYKRFWPWMEGRDFYLNNSEDGALFGEDSTVNNIFTVVQYIDARTMRIARKFDSRIHEWLDSKFGWDTGATTSYTLRFPKEDNTLRYSSRTKDLGYQPEFFPVANRHPVPMNGDSIVGLAVSGEWLLIFGRNGVYRILDDGASYDDDGRVPYGEADLVPGAPGCAARRSIVATPDGSVLYWTPDNRLAKARPEGGGYVEGKDKTKPLSRRWQGWMETNVESDLIHASHARYDALANRYEIFFIARDDTYTPVPEGSAFEVSVPTTDFHYSLIVDLGLMAASVCDYREITCTVDVVRNTATAGEPAGMCFAGDTMGYINKYGEEDLAMTGPPKTAVSHRLASSGSDRGTVVITTATAGYTTGFPPTTYDTGQPTHDGMRDLWAIAYVNGSWERRRIRNNSYIAGNYSEVSLELYSEGTPWATGTPFSATPTASTDFYVSAQYYKTKFGEFRFERPARFKRVRLDFSPVGFDYNTILVTPSFIFRIFAPFGNRTFAYTSGSETGTSYTEAQIYQGRGWFSLPPAAAKALALQLEGWQNTQFPIEIQAVEAVLQMTEGEMFKGAGK